MMKTMTTVAVAAIVLNAGLAMAAVTAAQKCEGGKNDASGKYAACMAKAEKSLVFGGSLDAYDAAQMKCADKYASTWTKLEGGGSCPTTGDESSIQSFIDACILSVADALGGGTLTSTVASQPLETGQTICYDTAGSVIACAGTGQDGELQNGAVRSFTDNGNGTITDNKTGLMWEKLDDNDLAGLAGIHDYNRQYTWDQAFVKVSDLNLSLFAGHSDWRLPSIRELETLKDFGREFPAIHPVFDAGCTPGCTTATCSCAEVNHHWSSSTNHSNPVYAWGVDFAEGWSYPELKTTLTSEVRAVRGGS